MANESAQNDNKRPASFVRSPRQFDLTENPTIDWNLWIQQYS